MPPRPNNHSSYGEEPAAAKSEASAPRGVLSGPKTYPVTPLLEAGAAQPAEPWLPPKRAFSTPQPGEAARGLLGDNFLDRPLLQRLDWIHVPLLLGTPVIALAGISQWAFDWRTLAFAVAYYFFSGLGITAGYHRYFAHRAFKATPLFENILMLMGTAAVEGSIKWWARGHRAHHKYVDTDKDPYAIIKGFWFAHIGWMLAKADKTREGRVNIQDLRNNPMIAFQNKWYLPLALFMSFVLPTLICGLLWGDYWGGYFVVGVARLVFVHHSTFCVNSLAHWAGEAAYTDGHTARNSIITALVTLGEGYHNFHHEFPSDYRNGVEWWQYDPTKHFIYAASLLGLAYDLQEFPALEISKGQLQMQQKALDAQALLAPAGSARAAALAQQQRALDARKERVFWGPHPETLKLLTMAEFEAACKTGGRQWTIIDGFVVDVSKWAPDHPGGAGLVEAQVGRDSTELFKGESGVEGGYKHSNAARNLVLTLRVARIADYWAK